MLSLPHMHTQVARWVMPAERLVGEDGEEVVVKLRRPGSDVSVCVQDIKRLSKSGASLGVAAATAFMVAALGQVAGDGIAMKEMVAMSGEVNMRGQLLPVGHIHKKLQAAMQAGCHLLVLPAANAQDVADLTEGDLGQWVRVHVVLASDLLDVLCHAVKGWYKIGQQRAHYPSE